MCHYEYVHETAPTTDLQKVIREDRIKKKEQPFESEIQ
jgi:hypothetical protein